ncbi:DUF2812 domain-containing protein [Radiobacillus kanasensis]|uniref:DUF2812 domain-containing protein n=1 Tax=Radiobacillus kanasensis TaxID=2844358 RepID=UPI001E2D78FA|nr:DUF2812 domain-containing protein [Radiobacillus kanasensis]UFT99593.1 DUF2812 domain-containing protein [Radiobacillus kanasensis]
MKKCKLFFNIVEEEQWLNEQLRKGYLCTNINGLGIYTFKKVNESFIIRLDYQQYLSEDKFQDYKTMYEDFGWTHVKGSRFGSIQYWQKAAGDQNEIFSDRPSHINYYKRLMHYSLSLAITFLLISYILYKDSSLYETQGLWDMEGALFWKAFLFETPFVMIKLIPLFMFMLSGFNYYKAYLQYKILKEI